MSEYKKGDKVRVSKDATYKIGIPFGHQDAVVVPESIVTIL